MMLRQIINVRKYGRSNKMNKRTMRTTFEHQIVLATRSFHATTSTSNEDAIINASQTSSGIIVDPYLRIKQAPSFFSAPLARISHMRKQTWKGVKSIYASTIVKKELGTEPHKFIDDAEDIFVQFHRAYSQGNKKVVRELVTPELYQSLKVGFKGNWALANTDDTPLEFHQINLQRRAGIPQCRLYYPDYKRDKSVGYAQLTVVISSIQKRSDKFIVPPKIKELTNHRSNNSGGNANVDIVNGVWKEEFDEQTGLPYYWHTKTRDVQWERPSTYMETFTELYNTPDDFTEITVENADGSIVSGSIEEEEENISPSPPPPAANENKKKKKKKKRRKRTIDDDVNDGTTQMVDGSKDQNTNYFYNIDNILVFERPFHNKNVQWRLMKI